MKITDTDRQARSQRQYYLIFVELNIQKCKLWPKSVGVGHFHNNCAGQLRKKCARHRTFRISERSQLTKPNFAFVKFLHSCNVFNKLSHVIKMGGMLYTSFSPRKIATIHPNSKQAKLNNECHIYIFIQNELYWVKPEKLSCVHEWFHVCWKKVAKQ